MMFLTAPAMKFRMTGIKFIAIQNSNTHNGIMLTVAMLRSPTKTDKHYKFQCESFYFSDCFDDGK